MIDLSKPIRRKGEINPVHAVEGYGDNILVEDRNGSYIGVYSRAAFDSLHENIPEPRKPREWYIEPSFERYELKAGTTILSRPLDFVRVIEWPEGAPLPDWPEGEGS